MPLAQLRETVRGAVERTSLRAVAQEVGMSHTGLVKFLRGSTPYEPTLRKLRAWFVRDAAAGEGTFTAATALAALAVLTDDLPPGERDRAAEALLTLLRREYDGAGVLLPPWLVPDP